MRYFILFMVRHTFVLRFLGILDGLFSNIDCSIVMKVPYKFNLKILYTIN